VLPREYVTDLRVANVRALHALYRIRWDTNVNHRCETRALVYHRKSHLLDQQDRRRVSPVTVIGRLSRLVEELNRPGDTLNCLVEQAELS